MSRIVLVDDNTTTLKRWEVLLAPSGHEILSFTGAEPALQVLINHPCDLLVLDLAMPVHTGYDLMQTLRRESVQVPILIVSGKTQIKDITHAVQLGASDYLLKPFDDDIFIAKVEQILTSYKSHKQSDTLAGKGNSSFAEAIYEHPTTTLSFYLPSIRISEMGFSFETQLPIPKGTMVQISAPCFKEMGIIDNHFKVTSLTTFSPPDTQSSIYYTVFVSFIGINLNTLKNIRLWVRRHQVTQKKAA